MLPYPYINIYIYQIIDLPELIIFKLIAFHFVDPKYGNGQITESLFTHFSKTQETEIT